MLDLSVQTDAFNNAVTRYVTTLGKDSRQAIRYQSMLLAKRLVQFTPPKTRSQGRKAVKRDIERAVTPIRPSDFSSKSVPRHDNWWRFLREKRWDWAWVFHVV